MATYAKVIRRLIPFLVICYIVAVIYMALGAVGLLVIAGMVLLLIAFRGPRPKTAMALAT
jgi:hypothetical protein